MHVMQCSATWFRLFFPWLLLLKVLAFGENCNDFIPPNCPSPCFQEKGQCVDECSAKLIYNRSEDEPCPLPCLSENHTCVLECSEGNIPDENRQCVLDCKLLYPEANDECQFPCLTQGLFDKCVNVCSDLFILDETGKHCKPKNCSELNPTNSLSCPKMGDSTPCYVQKQNDTDVLECVSECADGYEVFNKTLCYRSHPDCTIVDLEDCQYDCFVYDGHCVETCPEGFEPTSDWHYCLRESIPSASPPKKGSDLLIVILIVVGVVVGIILIVGVVCVVRQRGTRKQQYTEVSDGKVLEAYE